MPERYSETDENLQKGFNGTGNFINAGSDSFNSIGNLISEKGNTSGAHASTPTGQTVTAKAGEGGSSVTTVASGSKETSAAATDIGSKIGEAIETTETGDGDGMALLAIILLVFALGAILSQLPQDTLFTEGITETSREEKEDTLSKAYVQMKLDSRVDIIDTLDEEFDCGATFLDKSTLINNMKTLSEDADSFEFVTEAPKEDYQHRACNITIRFSPDVSEMTDNITAYTGAVDSTIGYYNTSFINKYVENPEQYYHDGLEEGEDATFDTRLLEKILESEEYQAEMTDVLKELEKGELLRYESDTDIYSFSENAKELFKQIDGAQTDYGSDEAVSLIAKNADTYFELDLEPERWDGIDTVTITEEETEEVTETQTVKVPVYDVSGQIVEYQTQEKEVVVEPPVKYQKVTATVTIPIYYGLLAYREDDIKGVIQSVVGQPYCKDAEDDDYHACTYDFATELVYNTMSEYYSIYQMEYNHKTFEQDGNALTDDTYGQITSSQNVRILDNREEIFAPLLKAYPGLTIPIYGLEGYQRRMLMAGVLPASYSGSITPASSLYEVLNSLEVWRHVKSLLDAGIIHGDYPYQCTTFVLAWLHDHYGMTNLSARDGAKLADSLAGTNGMTYLAGPAPGAVVSLNATKGNPNGHVLVIESVDAATNKIVVAEGNYTTNKAIQGTINTPVVRQTYTYEQWNARVYYRDPVYVGFPES